MTTQTRLTRSLAQSRYLLVNTDRFQAGGNSGIPAIETHGPIIINQGVSELRNSGTPVFTSHRVGTSAVQNSTIKFLVTGAIMQNIVTDGGNPDFRWNIRDIRCVGIGGHGDGVSEDAEFFPAQLSFGKSDENGTLDFDSQATHWLSLTDEEALFSMPVSFKDDPSRRTTIHELSGVKPSIRTGLSGNQNINSAEDTVMLLRDDIATGFDIGNHFSNGAHEWTPPAGKYRVSVHAQFSSTGAVDAENLRVFISVDGVTRAAFEGRRSGTSDQSVGVTTILDLDGIEVVTCSVRKGGAGNGSILATDQHTQFVGELI